MEKYKYVDPMIGTVGDDQSDSPHGGGKTHPGACVPGGMVQLSPDTVTGGDNGTGYNYCYDTIEGFSFNHMSGIGWYGDLGNLQIMPVTGDTDLRSGSNREITFRKGTLGWKSPFSHDREWATAGYYAVMLERYNIKTECTVSPHTGMLRITYPEKSDARAIFNFSRRIGGRADFQEINIISDTKIEGKIICTPKGGGFGHGDGHINYVFNFVCEFSVPAKKMRFFSDEEFADENITSFQSEDAGLIVYFGEDISEPVMIKCAVSYTDIEGARKNFSEADGFDFNKMKKAAEDMWEEIFSCVSVEGYDETDLILFYTCLYHALLDPRITADTDGRFAIEGDLLKDDSYTHRTVFSGWDVYRSEFPLLTLIRPDIVNDTVNSLLKIACLRNSSFPQWELMGINAGCMVGDPGLIVVSDAYVKGIRNYDTDTAYKIAKASALSSEELFGKEFHSVYPKGEQYEKYGFVPDRISNTLEFLLADYSLSRFAKEKGEAEDAELFENRAKRYKDSYNPRLGFMAPKKENGSFRWMWGRYDDNYCVESNIFQQSWFVPYDVKGLSRLFGEKRTVKLLETFFRRANLGALWSKDYNHSNEPCHNITHYFSMLGLPHRTQYWTRRVQKEAYRLGAFGFCGNEDVGQLSAWYVLSAIGFAQPCAGSPLYFINTPLFRSASIRLNKEYHSCSVADVFKVQCDKNPLTFPYIEKAYLNGSEITTAYLTYEQITAGGVFSLSLSDKPQENSLKEVPESFFGDMS